VNSLFLDLQIPYKIWVSLHDVEPPFIHSNNAWTATTYASKSLPLTKYFRIPDEETDNRNREIESAKDDLLTRAKKGGGHWKEELASQSESVVKAERSEIEANDDTIRKLQEESIRATVTKKK